MPSDVTPQPHDPSNGTDPRWVLALNDSVSTHWQFHSWLLEPSRSLAEGDTAIVNGVESVVVGIKDKGCDYCASHTGHNCFVISQCLAVLPLNAYWVPVKLFGVLRLKGEI